MTPGWQGLWVYLASTPLLGLASTLVAWQAATALSARLGNPALLNPIPVAILLLVAGLLATGMPYQAYFDGAQYIHILLGPATVALAVPLHSVLGEIRRHAVAVLAAVLAGAVVAAGSAMLVARWLGASREVALSVAPKSATTPIAMGIAEQIGGLPSLTALCTLLTGITAVTVGPPLLRALEVADWRARGLAAGVAGHGMATARVLLLSETAGAFGGLAIGLNGVLTALVVPLLARWLLP